MFLFKIITSVLGGIYKGFEVMVILSFIVVDLAVRLVTLLQCYCGM